MQNYSEAALATIAIVPEDVGGWTILKWILER
jgi:hypothetical protein